MFALDRAAGHHKGALDAARVSILDDRRARVLGSLPVDAFPVGVAVDAPAARLFVVNYYASCHPQSQTWAGIRAVAHSRLPFLPQAAPEGQVACAVRAA